MKSAPITPDEAERLRDLYRYDVLDTAAEKVFDDLTQLASEICETPIALISLVDPDRQWFKSKVGIDAEETSRDIAFCAHAIHQREVFEVCDTLQDERFHDNPLVTGNPNIRFYAGAQLVTPDGHAIGTLCTISDKPKSLTAQQKDALQILSREVISQMELRLKIAQLKQADQRKTDYLSNISHELRTPLNAIVCYSQLLQEQFPQLPFPDEVKEFIDNIDSSSRHLLSLINSVLDIHKIEEGKMVIQPKAFNCKTFFDDLRGLTQARADQRQIELHYDIDISLPENLWMDQAKLQQILVNLVTNAVKFSEPCHHVLVKVSSKNEQLHILVEDQGCGIARENLDKIFDKFSQVATPYEKEGSGLGLVISKGLTELMGGQLSLQSVLGEGTQVKVTFPLLEPKEQPAPDNASEPTPQFNKEAKVLVVEDNKINQQVAQWVFDSIGLTIQLADSGEEALKMANQAFDIVFMDLHLPGIDGFETTQQLLAITPSTPIVALSADAFSQTNEKATLAGMCDSLTKPIDKGQLIRILNRLIPA